MLNSERTSLSGDEVTSARRFEMKLEGSNYWVEIEPQGPSLKLGFASRYLLLEGGFGFSSLCPDHCPWRMQNRLEMDAWTTHEWMNEMKWISKWMNENDCMFDFLLINDRLTRTFLFILVFATTKRLLLSSVVTTSHVFYRSTFSIYNSKLFGFQEACFYHVPFS